MKAQVCISAPVERRQLVQKHGPARYFDPSGLTHQVLLTRSCSKVLSPGSFGGSSRPGKSRRNASPSQSGRDMLNDTPRHWQCACRVSSPELIASLCSLFHEPSLNGPPISGKVSHFRIRSGSQSLEPPSILCGTNRAFLWSKTVSSPASTTAVLTNQFVSTSPM